MVSGSENVSMTGHESKKHKPFTVEENIHQLNAIDNSVVQLMRHTAVALNALTIPSSSDANESTQGGPKAEVDADAQKQAFRAAADSFLTTLHSIDVRMKRQVLALDEAGIIDLSNTKGQEPGGVSKAALKPNGIGAIGNLDVGWLNSRGTRVERDMELELWRKARDFLDRQSQDQKME